MNEFMKQLNALRDAKASNTTGLINREELRAEMNDLISRQKVLNLIRMVMPEESLSGAILYQSVKQMNSVSAKQNKTCEFWDSESSFCTLHRPSAEPKGTWLDEQVSEDTTAIDRWQSCKCSVCGRYDTRPYLYYFDTPHYCSWCGADMRGEEDV